MAEHTSPAKGSRTAVFAPLSPDTRTAQVTQRLTDAILLGVLAPGERLPTESDLAKKFGVAVVTAREALADMRKEGLLETRRGREGGSFVRAEARGASQQLMTSRLRGISRTELLDAAVYLEVITSGALDRASQVCTLAEAAALEHWLDRTDFSTPASAARDHGGFLLELCVLSQSPRLVREQIGFQAQYGQLMWLGLRDEALAGRIAELDRAMVHALTSRDAMPGRAACQESFSLLSTWLISRKQELEVA
ncbi:hypothetical protein RN04_02040 [Arthrobacter sp. W1]|nr:hypothetical protein RN04_02040 [Arthrobacter sp. W1]